MKLGKIRVISQWKILNALPWVKPLDWTHKHRHTPAQQDLAKWSIWLEWSNWCRYKNS